MNVADTDILVHTLLHALNFHFLGPEEAQIRFAELRQRLEAEGRTVGMADCAIAAVCVGNGGVLLIQNRKHFERTQELKLSHVASA